MHAFTDHVKFDLGSCPAVLILHVASAVCVVHKGTEEKEDGDHDESETAIRTNDLGDVVRQNEGSKQSFGENLGVLDFFMSDSSQIGRFVTSTVLLDVQWSSYVWRVSQLCDTKIRAEPRLS